MESLGDATLGFNLRNLVYTYSIHGNWSTTGQLLLHVQEVKQSDSRLDRWQIRRSHSYLAKGCC